LLFLEKGIEVLSRLGLTKNQARVYLSLVNSYDLTASQIAQQSGIGREEIYRITPKLQKIGLIQASISVPTRFSAVPFENAIEILMEIRENETKEIQDKTRVFCKFVTKLNHPSLPLLPQFNVISGRERLIRLSTELLGSVQNTLCITSTRVKLVAWLNTHEKLLKNLLAKGISINFIVEVVKDDNGNNFGEEQLLSYPNFTLKITNTESPVCLGLFDNRAITIVVLPKTAAYGSPVYWSNNPAIIEMGQAYFENLWDRSKNIAYLKTKKKALKAMPT
jgi:HTH-type transcriptional regulator, sugar sensing transcriptional regulator